MRRLAARFRTWTSARRLTAICFLALLVLVGPGGVRLLEGSAAATRLLDVVPFVDPLATLESGLASREATETMLLGTGLLVLAAVCLGPIFCGWVCPLGLVLDLNQAGRKAVRRLVYGRRRFFAPAPRRLPAGMRYAVLGVLLGVAFVAQFPVFQVLSPINLLAKSVVFGVGLGLAIVAVIVVVEWFVPRLWCRALCPLGALYSLVGRRALLRVRFDPVLADHQPCRLCAANCPMGIPVMDYRAPEGPNRVDDPSCIRCGTCVDTCPRGMLGLGFRPLRASPGRPSLVPTCRHDG